MLGPVPGVIGALQAAEAVRLLAGQPPAFVGQPAALPGDGAWRCARCSFRPNPACRVCGAAADDPGAGGRSATAGRVSAAHERDAPAGQTVRGHDLPGVRRALAGAGSPRLRAAASGRWTSTTTAPAIARDADRGRRSRPARTTCGATASCCPRRGGPPEVGLATGHDAAGAGRSAGPGAGPGRGLGQERGGQPPLAVVQGPGGVGGAVQGARAGDDHGGLRLDRQPGQRLAALAAPLGMPVVVLVPHDLEPAKLLATTVYGAEVIAVRGSYDDVNRLASELADRLRLGLREREPQAVLRRGVEDRGLRDRRAAGLAAARPRGGAHGRRLAAAQDPPGASGVRRAGAGAGPGACRVHGAQAAGCAPDRPDDPGGPGRAGAGQAAAHHRQLAGHRQPGRRRVTPGRPSSDRAASRRRPTTTRSSRACACWPRPTGIFGETAGGVVVAAHPPPGASGAHRRRRRAGGAVPDRARG